MTISEIHHAATTYARGAADRPAIRGGFPERPEPDDPASRPALTEENTHETSRQMKPHRRHTTPSLTASIRGGTARCGSSSRWSARLPRDRRPHNHCADQGRRCWSGRSQPTGYSNRLHQRRRACTPAMISQESHRSRSGHGGSKWSITLRKWKVQMHSTIHSLARRRKAIPQKIWSRGKIRIAFSDAYPEDGVIVNSRPRSPVVLPSEP